MRRSSSAILLALVVLRVKLLLRQKFGWISVLVGSALVVLALPIAQASFVNIEKIFLDFSLAAIFLMQAALAIFLGTQIFHEERGRRTLHLLLSSGLSRGQWITGVSLGIWFALIVMQVLWFALVQLTAMAVFKGEHFLMAAQSLGLQLVATLVIFSLGLLASLFLRPALALIATAVTTFFLYGLSSFHRVFTQPSINRRLDDTGMEWVFVLGRLMPPLEWLDLKAFVGYESQIEWGTFFGLAGAGLAWSAVLLMLSWMRFERMDL